MVLEEASGGSDEPYGGNGDSEAGWQSSNFNSGVKIDVSTLAKPAPIVGWVMTSYTTANRQMRVQQALDQASEILHRPLREEEAQALAQNYCKIIATASWGFLIGGSLGGYQCYRTADRFRFPFWQPNLEKFTPDKFWVFRGPQARMVWHNLRAWPYVALGAFLGDSVCRNYATVRAIMGIKEDQRLSDFHQALNGAMARRAEEVSQRRQRNRPSPSRGEDSMSLPNTNAEIRRRRTDDDDMSPTGGAFLDSYGVGSDTDSTKESHIRAAQEAARAAYAYNSEVQRDASTRVPTGSDSSSRSYSFDLNAEPKSDSDTQSQLPPWARNRNSNRSSPPQAGSGSSWDRLRREAQGDSAGRSPTSSGNTRRDRETGSAAGDSFSFSSADEERKLAKSEAQKDFDSRLERERQGKNFDEPSRGRW